VTTRSLPSRPDLNQLKRQAKELLRRQPQLGRLRDAQRTLAEEYGFASWDALRRHIESLVGLISSSIIKPPELDSEEGVVVWNALTASRQRRRGHAPAVARTRPATQPRGILVHPGYPFRRARRTPRGGPGPARRGR
jgi:hypothetical protein